MRFEKHPPGLCPTRLCQEWHPPQRQRQRQRHRQCQLKRHRQCQLKRHRRHCLPWCTFCWQCKLQTLGPRKGLPPPFPKSPCPHLQTRRQRVWSACCPLLQGNWTRCWGLCRRTLPPVPAPCCSSFCEGPWRRREPLSQRCLCTQCSFGGFKNPCPPLTLGPLLHSKWLLETWTSFTA